MSVAGTRGKITERLSALVEIEDKLAAVLKETAGDVARSECFDGEQRAEVYAIIEAMRSDVESHRRSVGRWVNDRTGEVSDV